MLLRRPLPLEAPDNLAVVWQTDEGGQAVVELTYPTSSRVGRGSGSTFRACRGHGIAQLERGPARSAASRPASGSTGSRRTSSTPLGVRPLLERGAAGHPAFRARTRLAWAVLNHGTWVRRFGARPDVVGTTMLLDGECRRDCRCDAARSRRPVGSPKPIAPILRGLSDINRLGYAET